MNLKFIFGILAAVILVAGGIFAQNHFSNSAKLPSTDLYFGSAIFGSGAHRVSFIARGSEIYVDKNLDNVPQPDELNSSGSMPTIEDPSGQSFKTHGLRLGIRPDVLTENLSQQIVLTVDVDGKQSCQLSGSIVLSKQPPSESNWQEANNWLRFGEPINLILDESDWLFRLATENSENTEDKKSVGSKTEIRLIAGAYARADDRNGTDLRQVAFVVPTAGDIAPQLKIEFPSNEFPIVQEYTMDHFC